MQVSVGIFAHNEERTLARSIDAFLQQQLNEVKILEIIVVSCGSTDGTVDIARRFAEQNAHIRVIDRPERQGKLAAINDFLAASTGQVVLIAGADLIPSADLVERLVLPMARDGVCAMTGPRILSSGGRATLAGRLHSLLWQLHHEVALDRPKLGEIVAVRSSFLPHRLTAPVNCDEVLMEAEVIGAGGRLAYVPEAEVRNFPPHSVGELYGQRRRIACQHRVAARLLAHRPATTRKRGVARAMGRLLRSRPGALADLVLLSGVEAVAQVRGRIDAFRGNTYQIWRPVVRDTSAHSSHVVYSGAEGEK
ncbi:glycosyltransferase [Streptomyces sp. NPDC057521]|uniref:glycosyltransferase n=1 Tax=Streptomyces sp. NPDC057521 TaxID=3346156 RepID=UPI0036901D25